MPLELTCPKDVAAIPEYAQKTDSGIGYIKLNENPDGDAIADTDWVMLHYSGWTTDGKMFDSSLTHGRPVVFPLEQLIPGMKEALQLAKIGESIRAWIPEELAYKGVPNLPQGMLVFDFEILKCVTPQVPPLKPTDDAIKLNDGLSYTVLSSGKDNTPIHPTDTVALDFIGWRADNGERFHSSLEIGEPLSAQVNQLFRGLRDVLVHVHKGDIVIAWVPQKLGIDPRGDELQGDLVFSFEVLDVHSLPDELNAPNDVAAPPADAEITHSNLASKCLKKGSGTQHPAAASRVRVHYAGWTTDGQLFDASKLHGNQPAEFNLNQVIPGWTEGVQLMVEGEKRRFWIPENLAYKGMPGTPQGMLVFDVELLAIL